MIAETTPPFDGVRVVELAGPLAAFAGRQLAELGAEVILVEPPGGARTRHRQPFLEGEPGVERSLHHLHFNAGKRSVVLDLETEEGREDFRRLAATADAVLECERPGAMDARDVGFEALQATNAGLLYVTITPFSQEGPLSGYLGNDLIGSASSGLMYLNGFPEDPPNVPGAEQAMHMASLAAVTTLLVTLVGRERGDPAGHRIDVSMQEAASISTIQTANANFYGWHGEIPTRVGITSPVQGARSLFPCADEKWISFVVPIGAPAIWKNFTDWVEAEGIIEPGDERFADSSLRAENPALLAEVIGELCSRYPRAELFAKGQGLRLLAMPVNNARDLIEDEHFKERQFFVSTRLPQLDRELTDVSPPYHFGLTPALRGLPAPTLGELTADLLGTRERSPSPPPRPAGDGYATGHPLAGIRVCDFTWLLAGPLSTRVLADYGADVIKIESQARIDTIRVVGSQPTEPGTVNTNGVFNDGSANKRSMQLNLSHPRGVELAKELVEVSDIVMNNFTPTRMDRWGLGYEDLRLVKPDLIMLTMPVMGAVGPYSAYGSYGNGVIAYGGMSQNMGFAGRPPSGIAPLYSDFAAPFSAVSALMAALRHRERTGEGQFIELAQAEATVNLIGTDILEVTANGDLPPQIGNRSRDVAPHGAFPCAGDDRWIAIACERDEDWQRLAGALGIASEGRFASLEGRREHEDDLEAVIAERTRTRDAWELMHELQAAGVMAAVVEDLADMVDRDPHMQRHLVPTKRDDEQYTFLTHAQPAWIDGQVPSIRRAPQLGEHNLEVYQDLLGLSDGDVATLVADGVIY